MNHYNNNDGSDWEFQWVEDSVNYTGQVFIASLCGLSCVVGNLVAAAAAALKEKPKK